MITIDYLRTFRVGEYAIFDLTISFIGILVLSPLLIRLFRLIHLEIPLLSWIFLTLPLGIVTHILTGNHTLMTKYFLDPSSHYFLKLLVIAVTVLGLAGIRIIK